MPESIIVAIIAGVVSLTGTIISVMVATHLQSKKAAVVEAEREARQAMRLDSIEKKLDIHNGYAEKFGDIQKDIAVIRNDIEHLQKGKK